VSEKGKFATLTLLYCNI